MQTKDYNREELQYHQSENNYTLIVPKKFLSAKDIIVKKKILTEAFLMLM